MRTITGTLNAYSYQGWAKPAELIANEDVNRSISSLLLSTNGSADGYVKLGTAQITVTFDDDDKIVDNMVVALKAQKQKVQADAQVEINRLDERIQSLLALPAPSEATA